MVETAPPTSSRWKAAGHRPALRLSPPGTHTSAVVFAGSTARRAKPSASFLHRVATRPYAEPNLPSEP